MYPVDSGQPAAKPSAAATYADLLATPPDTPFELVDGELYAMPGAAVKHALAVTEIGMAVRYLFGAPTGGWLILAQVEVHLGRPDPRTLVLIPDVAGWRRERLAVAPDTQGIDVVPDWVCEVLSPSNEYRARGLKLRKYAGAGVPWVWLANPRAQAVEVFKLDGQTYRSWQVVESVETAEIAPFESVVLNLRQWWISGDFPVVADLPAVAL